MVISKHQNNTQRFQCSAHSWWNLGVPQNFNTCNRLQGFSSSSSKSDAEIFTVRHASKSIVEFHLNPLGNIFQTSVCMFELLVVSIEVHCKTSLMKITNIPNRNIQKFPSKLYQMIHWILPIRNLLLPWGHLLISRKIWSRAIREDTKSTWCGLHCGQNFWPTCLWITSKSFKIIQFVNFGRSTWSQTFAEGKSSHILWIGKHLEYSWVIV